MGTIREALIRNGVFLYDHNGQQLSIEDGAGCYMVARDRATGLVKYRIEASSLSQRLAVRDMQSGSVVTYLEMMF